MSSLVIQPQKETASIESLIRDYTPLVKKIAHHLLIKLPQTVQLDDLMQSGMIGLIEAAKNFDDSKGASFATYASIRIKGAMLDEMRRGDWAPRSVHRNARKLQEATLSLQANSQTPPKDVDIARQLGISLDEYYQYQRDSSYVKIQAFEDITQGEETMTVNPFPNPHENTMDEDFKFKLNDEIKTLPEKEKRVLALYYLSELNLREVGQVLGVSESRISQIHSQAVSRLKTRIEKWA